MSSKSAARRPADRILFCSSAVLMLIVIEPSSPSGAAGGVSGAKLTFAKFTVGVVRIGVLIGPGQYRKQRLDRRRTHVIKRAFFWQRKPHTHRHVRPGASQGGLSHRTRLSYGMRGGSTPTIWSIYAQRVHATDAGSGCPFRTSNSLLEPEDGSLHFRRTQPYSYHQPREDPAA